MKTLLTLPVRVMIQCYRWGISPLLPVACRFHPTCSCYAREALEAHGLWRGGLLALIRILKCNPFGPSGFDPVPTSINLSLKKHNS